MKRLWGYALEIIAFLLMAGSLTVPLSVVAFSLAVRNGSPIPEAINLVACFLLCVIVLYIGTKVPVKKNRLIWALCSGLVIYASLGSVALFGFAKDTISILSPFQLETPNELLVYAGVGVMLGGILLAAAGRHLVRQSNNSSPRTAPSSPKIEAHIQTLTAIAPPSPPPQYVLQVPASNSVTVQTVAALPREVPLLDEQTYAPPEKEIVKYMRDPWGNLVVIEDGEEHEKK